MNTNLTRPLRGARGSSGFTLIELSVAVLIGLFLLAGLLTLVQDMRRTFGTRTASQLQDSQRLAMTLITDVVQSAGYYPDPTIKPRDVSADRRPRLYHNRAGHSRPAQRRRAGRHALPAVSSTTAQ